MEKTQEQDKTKEILDFLESISEKELDDIGIHFAVQTAEEIYQNNNFRHSYSRITGFILKELQNPEKTLQTIAENLRFIIEEIKARDEACWGKSSKGNKNCDNLSRLWDHINLEFVRFEYYRQQFSNIDESIQKSEEKIKDLYDKTKDSQNNVKDLYDKTRKIRHNLKTQQNQYITILGIFASIVVAFVGVFSFSTSVLVNIDKSSIYRLVFIVVLIACVFANILYYLFNFIKSLNNSQNQTSHKEIFWFNISMLFILAADTFCYFIVKIFGSSKIISMIQSLF